MNNCCCAVIFLVVPVRERAVSERFQSTDRMQTVLDSLQIQSNSSALSEQFQDDFGLFSRCSFLFSCFQSPCKTVGLSQSIFRAVSEQFQSNFRAISEQFQSNFRAISEQLQTNFIVVSWKWFWSNFRALSEHFQSTFRVVLEQFQSNGPRIAWHFGKLFNRIDPTTWETRANNKPMRVIG